MKKVLAIVLSALLLVAALVGCASKSEPASNDNNASASRFFVVSICCRCPDTLSLSSHWKMRTMLSSFPLLSFRLQRPAA